MKKCYDISRKKNFYEETDIFHGNRADFLEYNCSCNLKIKCKPWTFCTAHKVCAKTNLKTKIYKLYIGSSFKKRKIIIF